MGGQVTINASGGTGIVKPTVGTSGQSLTYVLLGTPRTCCEWRDLNANSWLMTATDTHLYTYNGSAFADVTPKRCVATGNLGTTNPLTTSSGSNTVTVADAVNTFAQYDWVYLSAGSSFNGVTILGWYLIQSATPGTSYTINLSYEASGSGTGGGTVAFQYPRQAVSNPFTFTASSSIVKVTQSAHGAYTNDWVTFPVNFSS